MTVRSTSRLTKVAVAVSAALALGYGSVASAQLVPTSAVADAFFSATNFLILEGDGAAGGGSAIGLGLVDQGPGNPPLDFGGTDLNILSSVTNTDVVANLNGGPAVSDGDATVAGAPASVTVSDGAGFVPGVTYAQPAPSPGNWAGAHTDTSGFALAGGAQINVHSQVVLDAPIAEGTSGANQNLLSQFGLEVMNDFTFQVSFNAELFLRAALAQDDINANADIDWNLVVEDANGNDILNWQPNGFVGLAAGFEGSCVAAGTCQEFADDFSLNDSETALSVADNQTSETGSFELELTLAPGVYNLSIFTDVGSDAAVVPEPHLLGLLGLGMIGMGAAMRKRRAS